VVNLRGVLSLGDVGGVAVLVASPLDRVSGNVRCADRTLDVIQVVVATMGRGVIPPRVPNFVTREDVEMHNVF